MSRSRVPGPGLRPGLGLWLLLAGANALAQGGDADISFSTGLEYSTGKYGGTIDIEELYVPISAVVRFDRMALSVSVPYLSVRAPSGTYIPDPGAQPIPGTGEVTTESGLGDVVVGLTVYDVYFDPERGIALDLAGKIKLGTADRDRGLGTGEADYLARADLYKFFDRFTLMGSAGYKLRGDPPGVDLENTLLGSVGGSWVLNDASSVGLIYDYRESSLQDGDPLSEVTLYTMHRLSKGWFLQFYAFAGFSDSSPDWGGGVYISIR